MGLASIFQKLSDWKEDKNLVSGINELFDASQTDYGRAMREEVWFRNILYYLGEQWIDYVKSLKTFRRRQLPDYIPTPVNNEIREFVRSVKALYLQQKFICSIAPNTNEKEDVKSAELGKILLENLNQYNDREYDDEVDKLTTGLPIFGTDFLRAFPLMNDDRWMFDKDGNTINMGNVSVEHVVPFQVYVDNVGDRLNKKRWIGIQSLKAKEWVEDTFKIKVNSTDVKSTDYLSRLNKLVANVCPWKGAVVDASTYSVEDDSLVLFKEVEFKPTPKYPTGRYVISCGDKILKKYDRMPIPVDQTTGQWFYSLTDFHYDYLPGSFWSEAGVSNLISPQNTLNEIDQALAINRKGVARPKLFSPVGLRLQKPDAEGSLGAGMAVYEYDPLLTGGAKPAIEQGVALPQQVLEERAINRTAIQDLGGDPKNIMRGNSPGAKASGVMVDALRETAERGKAPDIERYIRSLNKVNKKRLLLAQEIFTEERILKQCGKGNKWKIIRFKAADLGNNTDVRMELDSGLATTNSGKLQVILDFAQKGLFGDVANDPKLRNELLSRVGLAGATAIEDIDESRAETENAKMSIGDFDGIMIAQPDPEQGITPDSEILSNDPFFKLDNNEIHAETHRRFILSDEFSELDPKIQEFVVLHQDAHNQQVQASRKNAIDPTRDAREFLQLDKLISLTPNESKQVKQLYLGIEPDEDQEVTGSVTSVDMLNYKKEMNLKTLDGMNKLRTEMMKNAVRPKESKGRV